MPTTSGGAEERDRIAREVIRLQKKASYDIGPVQVYDENPFYVYNPSPEEWCYLWSLPEFVIRRKNKGYLVVTAERGLTHYRIPESEVDKGANCVRRQGLILMEALIPVHARAGARSVLNAIEQVDADLKAFISIVGDNAREVDHDRGIVKRNKKGMLSADEKAALRMKKLEMQIRRDLARQSGGAPVAVATQPTLQDQIEKDPGLFAPQGRTFVDHGSYREVVLTDDPSRNLEDLEDFQQ